MNSSIALGLSVLVLLVWGALGVFQKKAVNHLTPETALVWAGVGFILLQPFLCRPGDIVNYSLSTLAWAVANGVFNALGFMSLMAAMRHGGKASVVESLGSLYPLFFVIFAPTLLHEGIRPGAPCWRRVCTSRRYSFMRRKAIAAG